MEVVSKMCEYLNSMIITIGRVSKCAYPKPDLMLDGLTAETSA